ncbi:MAG TPA: hypothetical protein DCR43_02835 [Bacteroidales bacterium]|nr:MAG: hypothetical protein CVU06_12985 [Bacteroidetes bacterium HGW-Bacteroidetes-22]HAQ64779.1 hypothetical protein [Bacteroidales bacterium]HBZ67846.1 hypothetical protein [Bacteroidales bacterium]
MASDSFLFTYILVPVLIFLARISDQSIGTLRIIFVSKGYRFLGPFLGFFEVIIWLVAVRFALEYIDSNLFCYIGYGAGFAMGNYIGIRLEEKISLGTVLLRIIPKKDTSDLERFLIENHYGLTKVDAEGSTGKVKIIFTIIKRKNIPHVTSVINHFNPNAFYTIEEIKAVNRGVFKPNESSTLLESIGLAARKAK